MRGDWIGKRNERGNYEQQEGKIGKGRGREKGRRGGDMNEKWERIYKMGGKVNRKRESEKGREKEREREI